MPGSYTAMVVSSPRGDIHPVSVDTAALDVGAVRVTVVSSGVCNADIGTADAKGENVRFPVTPGHEVAGVVSEIGSAVRGWRVGDRVAVGWFGGSCGHCNFCRDGDVVHCPERKVPGLSYPGGWAESIVVPADALARIPEGLDYVDAAPFGCAGVTTFNAIRKARLRAGGRVAVFGLGGLGHLAVQFAAASGHEVIAIARGSEREDAARQLGAHLYIDSADLASGAALAELGGADLIVYTASSTEPVSELLTGLRVDGTLVLLGVDGGTLELPVAPLVMYGHHIVGHLTGSPRETEEAMNFAVVNGVRPLVERLPLENANLAVDRLRAGTARFRMVLDATNSR